MVLNNKNISWVICLIFVMFFNGCGFVNLNNQSLEEYGEQVRLSTATLVPYIGKNKEDVIERFGEPTEIKYDSSMIATHYQVEKVPFNELWYYIYHRGVPGINAEGSTKRFFFNDGVVVAVDAF